MIVRRRTWSYLAAGQRFVQVICFDQPVSATRARAILRRTLGAPVEVWGRGSPALRSPARPSA